MNLKELFVRPSDVVRSIEDGVVGSVELLHVVGKAAKQNIVAFGHGFARGYRIERSARTLAASAVVAMDLAQARSAEQMADLEQIKVRTAQLMARKSRKVA